MEHENSIRIAVIEEQISGLREQQRAHNQTSQRRFDHMEAKIDELVAVMNRGRGAYAASLLLAGILGGCLLKVADILARFFQR
jgi:hypothetical protein